MPGVAAAPTTTAVPHSVIDGRVLALDVGHAEPAADRQLGQAELAHPRGHDLHGLVEEVGHEHLAADVHVHADQLDRRRVLRPGPPPAAASPDGHAEAELGVVLAGPHELVGVGLDARA